MNNGTIWIIDSDVEDHDIVKEVWAGLGLSNKVEFFAGAEAALNRLSQIQEAPFIILCDINLPGMDGFQLRQKLLAAHSKIFSSVPFIFWSEHASEAQIAQAYNLSAHGFFVKDVTMEEWKDTFRLIISYWMKSKMPSKTDK
jgi:CheY-like chemotaxis protein